MPGDPEWPGEPAGRGDGAPPQPDGRALDYLTEGTKPRPVTVETAFRCRLWERGTLLHEDPLGPREVTSIFDDYTVLTVGHDEEVAPEAVSLLPERTLTFVPEE